MTAGGLHQAPALHMALPLMHHSRLPRGDPHRLHTGVKIAGWGRRLRSLLVWSSITDGGLRAHPTTIPVSCLEIPPMWFPHFLLGFWQTWGQACLCCHSPWPAPGGGHPGKRRSSLRHCAVPPGRVAGGLLGSEQKGTCVTQTVISSLHDSLVYNVRATLGKAASVLRTMPGQQPSRHAAERLFRL